MLALFSRLVRRLRLSRVGAPQVAFLDITGAPGVIKVEESFSGFAAEASWNGGNSVRIGFGATPFEALKQFCTTPVFIYNRRAFLATL